MPWSRKAKSKKTVRKRLADGTVRVYEYERGKPATAPRAPDSLAMLMQAYQASPEWNRLAEATKDRYARYLRPLRHLVEYPAAELTRKVVIMIRNQIVGTQKAAAANAFVRAVSAMYAWGIENEWVTANPTNRIKPLPGGHFAAWTPGAAARALEVMPEHLRRLILVALYTGQRRGDLCRLAWSNYDGARLRLTQEKTDVSLVIPVHPVLKAAMDQWPRIATTILVNARGWPWKPESASKGMKEAIDRLGFPPGWNIHGLRKLAAANLAEAGCSMNEIAAITGHKTTAMISFYTQSADQERMATAAIHRLPVGRK